MDQIFRYWALGMVIGSGVSVFARDRIHGVVGSPQGKRLGVLGIVAASILFLIFPDLMSPRAGIRIPMY